MNVPFMYNFRNLSNKYPYDFLKVVFSYFTTQVILFFLEKGNLKLSDSKLYDGERNHKNSHFRKTLNCTKVFGKITLKPL